MNIFGLHILSKSQVNALKAFGLSEVQQAVAAAKQTPLGAAVKAAINDATTKSLPIDQRLEKVVADIVPTIISYVQRGGLSAIENDVASLARELAQSVFNDVKSTTAGKVAAALLKLFK